MLENAEHDETQCSPGCCLQHTFCIVKLSVPNLETRSQMIVEVCVDLPTRLQFGAFKAFAESEQLEDAWVLLAAGQSPELAMLQMRDTASQPPPRASARLATKTLCKISGHKRTTSGQNSGNFSCDVQSVALSLLLAASAPSGFGSVLQMWPSYPALLQRQPARSAAASMHLKHGHLGICWMRHAPKTRPQQQAWCMVRIQAHTRVGPCHLSPSSPARLLH